MKEKNKNWIKIENKFEELTYYIPAWSWKTFDFQISYYPSTKVLQLEEKNKYFDGHAVIQLSAENLTVAEHLLEHIIGVMTI